MTKRIVIRNVEKLGTPGAVVITQTSGIGTDKITRHVAAILAPGQEITLSVFTGTRLSMTEKTTPASIAATPDKSVDLSESTTETVSGGESTVVGAAAS